MGIGLREGGVDGPVVRRLAASDAEGVLDAVIESGERLSRFETWALPPFDIDKAVEYVRWWTDGWDDQSAFFFAIVDGDRFLGACGLFDVRIGLSASMGYWVRHSATGRGVATRAATQVATWGFETLGLEWIDLHVSDSNPASVRVADKLGAYRDGELGAGLPLASSDADASIYRLESRSLPI